MVENVVVAVVQDARIIVVEVGMASSYSDCRSVAIEDCFDPVSAVGCDIGISLPYIIFRPVRDRSAGAKVLIFDSPIIDGVVIATIHAIEDLEPHGVIEPSSIASMILISDAALSDVLHRKRREIVSQSQVEVVCGLNGDIGVRVSALPLIGYRREISLTPVHIVSGFQLLQLGQVNMFHFNEISWSLGIRDGNLMTHKVFFRYFLGKIWDKLRISLLFEGCIRVFVVYLDPF